MSDFEHISGSLHLQAGQIERKNARIDPEEMLHSERESEKSVAQPILLALLAGKTPELTKENREKNIDLTRLQIRESVTPDLHIVNAINTVEEIDKVANTLVKRLREWYALYDPETEKKISDHKLFVEEILKDPKRKEKTAGADITVADRDAIRSQIEAIHRIQEQREKLVEYLEIAMKEHTPNLHRVAGATIGAKLISLAGGIKRLSILPSGTIQLLGAETALFRHLKNKHARPPKHGVIFNHVLLQRAPKQLRGKAARAIADAISIATKIDRFKGEYAGDMLYAKVERLIQEKKDEGRGGRYGK